MFTTWGLWDNKPYPSVYRNNLFYNARGLDMQYRVYDRGYIMHLVARYEKEYCPGFSVLFAHLQRKVSQSDIARYLIAYYHGGFYVDSDVNIINHNLLREKITGKHSVWFTEFSENWRTFYWWGAGMSPYRTRIAQWAFYTKTPRNDIFREILELVVARICYLNSYSLDGWSDHEVLWATGPDVVNTVLHALDPDDFVLIDYDTTQKTILHNAHGSWRNRKDQRR